MRLLIALLLASSFPVECYSQALDQSISDLAVDLGQKVSKKNRVKLALTDFVNNEGNVDALTDYIREELEQKLINDNNNLQIIDRKHIKLLLSEHQLQSEGLIDESTAKSVISFIKVDGWVIAEITTLGEQIKIKITVVDITTSQIYAASTSGLISDIAIKNLLEPEARICNECSGKGIVQLQETCALCEGKGGYSCTDCRGTGKRSDWTVGSYKKCETCNGVGKFDCKSCLGSGKVISYKTCMKCNGKVQLRADSSTQRNKNIELCTQCDGGGKIKSQAVCDKCGGSGEVPFGPRSNWERKPCGLCSGKGQIGSVKNCLKCNGTGKL